MRVVVVEINVWLLVLATLIALALIGALAWKIRREQQRTRAWRAALERMPLGVAIFDAGGKRLFANISGTALLQHLDGVAITQVWQAALNGTQQTTVARGRDGLVVQVQATALGAGAGVLVTLRDIAQQQRAEASYRQFIHTLSHELLTPLTAIQGHLAHIAASDRHDAAAWLPSLRVTRDEVERLTRLTSNLLILSRLEAGQPLQKRPTNLHAVAEEALLQLLPTAEAHGITLTLDAAPRLPRPALDRDAWKQVLFNLIENGIKYGRSGGAVTTSLRHNGTALAIAVQDDGPGILADDLPHVFTELFRAEGQRHVSGSGLGLAIVRRIVEQHGGQITCSSEPGQGTTFTITLPVEEAHVTVP